MDKIFQHTKHRRMWQKIADSIRKMKIGDVSTISDLKEKAIPRKDHITEDCYACHYADQVFPDVYREKGPIHLCLLCPFRMTVDPSSEYTTCLDGVYYVLSQMLEILYYNDQGMTPELFAKIQGDCVAMAEQIKDWPVKEGIPTK